MPDINNTEKAKDYFLVLATNIWSLHMVPLAKEIASIVGKDRFRMVLFEKVYNERLNMGWEADEDRPEWLAGPPVDESDIQDLFDICVNADVTILGAVSMKLMKKRVGTGKLTFIMSERILKKKWHKLRMMNPRYTRGIIKYRNLCNHPNVHALAIGHYAPADLRVTGAFKDRIWKWGYFVELNDKAYTGSINRPLQLLWVGRMLKWKRVDMLIKAVSKIQNQSWFGKCTIIGEGPEKRRLMHLAEVLKIGADRLEFCPPVKMEEVRSLMLENDVYVLTSNRQEGWGAVAGEAMSEGCVLVANEQAGASRSLITTGGNGFLFADGDVNALVEILSKLGNDIALREKIRQAAWQSIWESWSPRVAAERLINLSRDLLESSGKDRYLSGPGSRG